MSPDLTAAMRLLDLATRARRSSLIVPGGLPVTARASGDALSVLHTVVSDWPT